MKIRILTGPKRGRVFEVPADAARQLIAHGHAEEVGEAKTADVAGAIQVRETT